MRCCFSFITNMRVHFQLPYSIVLKLIFLLYAVDATLNTTYRITTFDGLTPALIDNGLEYRISSEFDYERLSVQTKAIIGVDAVYVTHWSSGHHSAGRKETLSKWLKENNIKSLWINDFNGDHIECRDLGSLYPRSSQKMSVKLMKRLLGVGELSLIVKHLFISWHMLQNGLANVLVLEDDAEITQNINDIKTRITKISDMDWDIVDSPGECYGGRDKLVDTHKDAQIFEATDHVMRCAHGYFLRKTGASKLLHHAFPHLRDNTQFSRAGGVTANIYMPFDNFVTSTKEINLYYFLNPSPMTAKLHGSRAHMTSSGHHFKTLHSCDVYKSNPIESKRRVFVNGHHNIWFEKLAYSLFVDYPSDVVTVYDDTVTHTTPNDVMLIGYHGPMSGNMDKFQGKKLYYNGEFDTNDDKFTGIEEEKSYYIGPTKKEDQKHIQVYYGAFAMFIAVRTNWLWGLNQYQQLTAPRIPDISRKSKFLTYTQMHCVDERETAFNTIVEHISKVSPKSIIEANGQCYGGLDKNKGMVKLKGGYWDTNNKADLNEFRFTLSMENKISHGYISEKIVNAFASHTVPIYWGTEEVFNVFNKDAFIYYDTKNPQPALDQIAELEMNDKKYYEMMSKPILASPEALEKYFSLDNDVGNGVLKNRIRGMLGIKYDKHYGYVGTKSSISPPADIGIIATGSDVDTSSITKDIASLMVQPPPISDLVAYPKDKYNGQDGQDRWVDRVFGGRRDLFVVESGAYDGLSHSNSFFLETTRGWSCLLIEANPYLAQRVVSRKRNCHVFKGGISITNGPGSFPFVLGGPLGGIKTEIGDKMNQRLKKELRANEDWVKEDGQGGDGKIVHVQCFPLVSVLNSINRDTIDYWSLDTEGSEIGILEHTDFTRITVGVITVEWNSIKDVWDGINRILLKAGFILDHYDGQDMFWYNPIYFEKKQLKFPKWDHRN